MICQVIDFRTTLGPEPMQAMSGAPHEHGGPAVAHLLAADALLAEVIRRTAPLPARTAGPVYDELVRAVLYQQLAGPAAAAIERRLRALFGGDYPRPHELIRASDDVLRGSGLSRQKVSYLRDLAAHATAGHIDEHLRDLEDASVIAAVTAVRGLGRWSADMLLIFGLGRPDVLPVGDFGIRKAMQQVYGLAALPAPVEMERIAAPWRPFRSTATQYLWRVVDPRAP